MARSAPPLPAIQAFLSATRAPSFRAAADDLALSPAAFSRRIQSLEAFLGVALFDRSGPQPRLTAAGEAYARELQPAIDSICATTDALRRVIPKGRLRVMCPGSFAMTWLMPRLREYSDRQGAQDVDLVISRDLNTLRAGEADLAIAVGPRDFGGLVSEPLLSLRGTVVAAPRLAGGREPPRSIPELHTHRLVGLRPPPDMPVDLWHGWLLRVGYRGPALPEPTRFDTWSLMYEAAANGLGITIAVPVVTEPYLRDGRLQPCFGRPQQLNVGYHLVYASEKVRRHGKVRELVAWMKASIQDSETCYASLTAADG